MHCSIVTVCLTFAVQVETIAAAPCSPAWTTNGLGVAITFAKASWALASRCETAQFTMFLYGSADPVNLWITTDGIVGWIDQNDFEVFVRRVLSNPVWVQYTQTAKATTNTFLLPWEKKRKIFMIKWDDKCWLICMVNLFF